MESKKYKPMPKERKNVVLVGEDKETTELNNRLYKLKWKVNLYFYTVLILKASYRL